MTPIKASAHYNQWPKVAVLIHGAFAYMEPILGHPARAASLTTNDLANAAKRGVAFVITDQNTPIACLFTRPSRDIENALYLGWLAVASSHKGRGLARDLINAAEVEARVQGQTALTLDTGRSIGTLHSVFERLGFHQIPDPKSAPIVSFYKALD